MNSEYKGHINDEILKLRGKPSFDLPLRQGTATLSSVATTFTGYSEHSTPVQLIRSGKGYIAPSFSNAMYNKIYLSPKIIDIGYVSTTRSISITLFNGYFNNKILTEINYSDEQGVKVSNVKLPLLFSRLSVRTLIIDIDSKGCNSINCMISFHFSNSETVTLELKGTRSQPFAIMPNWVNGVTETLEWKTNVHQSQTGAEQRVSMRLTPRRVFEFQALIYQQQRHQIENLLFNHFSNSFALPIYNDVALLDKAIKASDDTLHLSTVGRDYYVNGKVMVMSDSNIVVSNIANITESTIQLSEPISSDFLAGAKVFPVKTAKLTDPPKIIRRTDELSTVELRFLVAENNPINTNITLPTYKNFYVLEHEPEWSDNVQVSYESMRREIDNQTGNVYYSDTAQRTFITQSHQWLIHGRKEQHKLRSLFYALRGRQKPFLVPSFSHDCELTNDVTSEILDIQPNGLNETDKGGQFLRILLTKGRVLYREILTVKSNDQGKLRLVINSKATFSRNEVIKISIMRLCRLNDDKVVWQHLTDSDGTARVNVTFREVRYELE